MKRFLSWFSILIALGGATAAFAASRAWSEAQALTRAAPTLATEGMDLGGLQGFRVCLSAAPGQTLTAGSLAAWVYSYELAGWVRNPSLDLTISTTAQRRQCWPDQTVQVKRGRVLYAASSVTTSAGTVTVSGLGWLP